MAAVTTARAWFLDEPSGEVMHEAYVGLITPAVTYAATLPPRPGIEAWHEPEDLRWERVTGPNPMLDGLFAQAVPQHGLDDVAEYAGDVP